MFEWGHIATYSIIIGLIAIFIWFSGREEKDLLDKTYLWIFPFLLSAMLFVAYCEANSDAHIRFEKQLESIRDQIFGHK